jgi:ankyrin repeat protein
MLMMAIASDNPLMIECVLSYCHNPNAVNYDGYNALTQAVVLGKYATASLLLESNKFDVNFGNPYPPNLGFTAFHYACMKTDSAFCRLLHQYHADINKKAACGQPPIVTAVSQGKCALVAWLLEVGADVRWVDPNDGTTLLTIAVLNECTDLIELLIQYRAPFKLTNQVMKTMEDDNITKLVNGYLGRKAALNALLLGTHDRLGATSPLQLYANHALYDAYPFRIIYDMVS